MSVQPRGERRREALLEAAADLLLEQGLGALSHRAVATRAGLPLAATTYYFSSREDLAAHALRTAAERWTAQATDALAGVPARLRSPTAAAQALLAVVTGEHDREALLAMYERYLEAGRSEQLRPVVVELDARVAALAAEVLRRAALPADPGTARLVLATLDGLLLSALATGEDDPAGTAAPLLRRMLAALDRP